MRYVHIHIQSMIIQLVLNRPNIWFLMQDVSGSLDFCKVCHLIFYYTL